MYKTLPPSYEYPAKHYYQSLIAVSQWGKILPCSKLWDHVIVIKIKEQCPPCCIIGRHWNTCAFVYNIIGMVPPPMHALIFKSDYISFYALWASSKSNWFQLNIKLVLTYFLEFSLCLLMIVLKAYISSNTWFIPY